MSVYRTPIVCAKTWNDVMQPAAWRCQCHGACGAGHREGGGRCDRTHGNHQLVIGPEDATLSDVQAAAVPTRQLKAWCVPCRQRLAALQLKAHAETQAAAPVLALFDL